MSSQPASPPLVPRILLRLTLPRGILRESVRGDLTEEFRRRVRTHGSVGAARWYRREALRLAVYGVRHRFATAGSRPRTRLGNTTQAPQTQGRNTLAASAASTLQDFRFAARALGRTPGFAIVAGFTIALGIGATVTVFSLVDGVVLRPLPYPEADALVRVGFGRESGRVGPTSGVFLDAWRSSSTQLTQVTGNTTIRKVLTGAGEPTRLRGAAVSADYFGLLGVPFALGAGFSPEYDEPTAPRVVAISHRLWRTRWGADPDILGRAILLNDTAFTVTGVVGSEFHPPEVIGQSEVDFWSPLGLFGSSLNSATTFFVSTLARVADHATIESARHELRQLSAGIAETFPAAYADWLVPNVRPLHDQTVGGIKARLYTLLGAVTFVLLIACANVANLFLARGTDRARELTIRMALGAGRRRIARLVLAESLIVAFLGCAGGTMLAFLGLRVFRSMSPGDIPRLAEVAVDLRVLAFATLLAAFTGVLFGIAPALAATRRDASAMLNSGGANASAGREKLRLRGALVVTEVASALVLIVGAGLLLNSFLRLSTVDPGFDPTSVETLAVALGPAYSTQERRMVFFDQLLERTEALPGVTEAALTADLPMSGDIISTVYLEDDPGTAVGMVQNHAITPGYFATFGMTLRPGSRPLPHNPVAGERVVVVNEAFTQAYWTGEQALGKRLRYDDNPAAPWYRVVGVVNDTRFNDLAEAPEPQIYYPYQFVVYPARQMYIAARTTPGAPPVGPSIRQLVRELDPALPVSAVIPMSDRVAGSVAEPRFYTTLLMTFAAIALALAAVGVYATMAYVVGRRTRELGIRIALGARPAGVVRLVLLQGGALAGIGAVIGLLGAAALSRVLSGLLFGITATDPWTFGAAAAVLGGVALLACLVPARRATRVDPVRTLNV